MTRYPPTRADLLWTSLAVLVVLVGGLLLASCGAAEAQEVTQAGAAPADPLVTLITTLLGSSPTTAVLVALGGLYFGGPRLGPRLGLGPDPGLQTTLQQINATLRRHDRELRWQAKVMAALATAGRVTIPDPPSDEDEPVGA